MRIIVNGKDINTDKRELSYKEIIDFARVMSGCTITYRGKKRDGVLFRGERVKIEEDMVFNAAHTGQD